MSSQPFLVLDRNLIVIMKHYSHSSVESPAFVFETSCDYCLPFESISHNPHNNFFYSMIIYYSSLPECSVTPRAVEDWPC